MTVSSINELKQWLESNKISEVECVFPDMAGSSKGKIYLFKDLLNLLKAKFKTC